MACIYKNRACVCSVEREKKERNGVGEDKNPATKVLEEDEVKKGRQGGARDTGTVACFPR